MLKISICCKCVDLKAAQLKAASRKRGIKEGMGLTFGKNKKAEKGVKEKKLEVEKKEEQAENVKDEGLRKLEELFTRDIKLLDEEEEELDKEMKDNQRKREEIEIRRKLEEDILRRLEELCATKVEALRPKNNSNVKETSSSKKPDEPQTPPRKTYDLSRWKYSQLREAINTSTDIELLEGCREEFQRRMKMYQDWRSRNVIRSNSEQKRR